MICSSILTPVEFKRARPGSNFHDWLRQVDYEMVTQAMLESSDQTTGPWREMWDYADKIVSPPVLRKSYHPPPSSPRQQPPERVLRRASLNQSDGGFGAAPPPTLLSSTQSSPRRVELKILPHASRGGTAPGGSSPNHTPVASPSIGPRTTGILKSEQDRKASPGYVFMDGSVATPRAGSGFGERHGSHGQYSSGQPHTSVGSKSPVLSIAKPSRIIGGGGTTSVVSFGGTPVSARRKDAGDGGTPNNWRLHRIHGVETHHDRGSLVPGKLKDSVYI
jgi:hypothetical protein